MVIESLLLSAVVREAAERGFARLNRVLSRSDQEGLLAEADDLQFTPLRRRVGRVHQSGESATVWADQPGLPLLATLLWETKEAVARVPLPECEGFLPTEAVYQRYRAGRDGISTHRDQSFYRIAVVIFTLEGSAPFSIFDTLESRVVAEGRTEPGDVCVLAGGGLGRSDMRPPHAVGPPDRGGRTSLTLRMKEAGKRPRQLP